MMFKHSTFQSICKHFRVGSRSEYRFDGRNYDGERVILYPDYVSVKCINDQCTKFQVNIMKYNTGPPYCLKTSVICESAGDMKPPVFFESEKI